MNLEVQFAELKGKTLADVSVGNEEIVFETTEGHEYRLYHSQDCCESVTVESVTGDVKDLIGEPILLAEEATSDQDPDGYKTEDTYRESFTWTFYKLATRKGYVDIRWLGESNGYYSESVDFARIK